MEEGGGKTLVLYLINKQRLAAVATDLMPLVAEYPCYSYLRMVCILMPLVAEYPVLLVARNPTVNRKL